MVIWKDKTTLTEILRANFDIMPKDKLTLSLNTSYSTIDAIMLPE